MNVRKFLLLTAVAILVYTLVAHPTQLGDGVRALFGWIGEGIEAIIAFLRSVTGSGSN